MWISLKIPLKFVRKGPINNIPVLVQIMAWRRPGDKPLSEPMLVFVPMHICVTRPQWVNAAWKLPHFHKYISSHKIVWSVFYHQCYCTEYNILLYWTWHCFGWTKLVKHQVVTTNQKLLIVSSNTLKPLIQEALNRCLAIAWTNLDQIHWCICVPRHQWVNTFRPRQNGRYFADDIFKCIFMHEFRLRFHLSLFLRCQLTILQHWFR